MYICNIICAFVWQRPAHGAAQLILRCSIIDQENRSVCLGLFWRCQKSRLAWCDISIEDTMERYFWNQVREIGMGEVFLALNCARFKRLHVSFRRTRWKKIEIFKKKGGGGGCLYASLRNAPWLWAPLFVDYKATSKVMISWLSRTVKHQTKVTMPQQHLQQQSRHGCSPPFSFSHFSPSTETVRLWGGPGQKSQSCGCNLCLAPSPNMKLQPPGLPRAVAWTLSSLTQGNTWMITKQS